MESPSTFSRAQEIPRRRDCQDCKDGPAKNHSTHLDTSAWRSYLRNYSVGPVIDAISSRLLPDKISTLNLMWESVSGGPTNQKLSVYRIAKVRVFALERIKKGVLNG